MHLGLDSIQPGDSTEPGGLLAVLLRNQQASAAETFARWHECEAHGHSREAHGHCREAHGHSREAHGHGPIAAPTEARRYRDLIPLSQPGPGEQYAFEVDLDACSGCKSCVVACHNLNGLEESEMWRSVGLLHGGSSQLPVIQHVTAACHHCVEPACLDGCPVNAYEKDPVTGIVRHLDDQCIGCRYCIFKCPYDVPKYSSSKGIVRKCDMCHTRLATGEAPACVQACPNQAIRISVVNKQDVIANAEANLFLPGAPEPGYTLPTTTYRTAKALPANLLPADYFAATPQHTHWPLVWMLVLTQMSVGAFLVDWWLGAGPAGGRPVASAIPLTGEVVNASGLTTARAIHVGVAFVCGFVGLAAAVGHLGRPWLAYRAMIGWRTSWLSREIIAFGLFAMLASNYAVLPWLDTAGIPRSGLWERGLGAAVALSGLGGVVCSVMIYASTRRVFWNPAVTGLKFLLTCLVLGIPVALLIRQAVAPWSASSAGRFDGQATLAGLCICLMVVSGLKLLLEGSIFCWLSAPTFTPLRRTALLMTGDLRRVTGWRFAVGIVGGVALPGVLVAMHVPPGADGATLGLTICILALCVVGELMERYLFFAAVVAPKMPGAPAT